jgi:hypothetical protein
MIEIVTRRRVLVAAVLAAALAAGVGGSLPAAAKLPGEPDLPAGLFGSRMARAEIVVVVGGVVHDYRLDQGRLRQNRLQELVILERDGTLQTVPVSPGARVTLDGAPVRLAALRRGVAVLTVRDGDAPAFLVRARSLFR